MKRAHLGIFKEYTWTSLDLCVDLETITIINQHNEDHHQPSSQCLPALVQRCCHCCPPDCHCVILPLLEFHV